MCSSVFCNLSCFRFDQKSWLSRFLALGVFAYALPARSLCCHIKSERCFIVQASTVYWYQIIAYPALVLMLKSHLIVEEDWGGWSGVSPELYVLGSVLFLCTVSFAFCVKGALFVLCTPVKALHTDSHEDPQRADIFLYLLCLLFYFLSYVLKGNLWLLRFYRSNFAVLTQYCFPLSHKGSADMLFWVTTSNSQTKAKTGC